MLCTKFNKKRSKIHKKHLSNQHSNLHRFWSQLGPILGRFWKPKWGQDGTKSLQKSILESIKKTITPRVALGTNFERFWAPTWPPRGVTFVYKFEHLKVLVPSWAPRPTQDLPRPPRPSQEPPKTNFRPQVHRFWGSTLLDLGSIWGRFGCICVPT